LPLIVHGYDKLSSKEFLLLTINYIRVALISHIKQFPIYNTDVHGQHKIVPMFDTKILELTNLRIMMDLWLEAVKY